MRVWIAAAAVLAVTFVACGGDDDELVTPEPVGTGPAIFASGATGLSVYLAAVLVGFSIGAEIDLLAFLTGRYFGLLNFGEIYGFLFASMMLGVSLGPPAFAFCFDSLGDYSLVLWFSCGSLILLSFIIAVLPAYPDFEAI